MGPEMDCMGILGWLAAQLPSCPAVVSRVVLVTSHQLGRAWSAWRHLAVTVSHHMARGVLSACRDKPGV